MEMVNEIGPHRQTLIDPTKAHAAQLSFGLDGDFW